MVTTKKKAKKNFISREEALNRHFKRNHRARCKDESELAKNVSVRPTKEWLDHPDRSDVLGIDAPTKVIPGHFKKMANGKMVWIPDRFYPSKKDSGKCSTSYEYMTEETRKRGINPRYLPDEDDD